MVKKWDSLFLLIMTLPIMGHVGLLSLLLDVAGRDGWISVLIALPVGLLTVFFIYRVRTLAPTVNFYTLSSMLCGKWGAVIVQLVLAAYLLFLSSFSIGLLVDMTKIAYLPSTPIWALTLWFSVFFLYAAYKGIKAIALTACVLGIVAMITGHAVTALDTPKKEFINLFPMFEFGFAPSLWGAVLLSSIWAELLFLLLLTYKNIREKRMFTLWVAGVLLNSLMMGSTTTGAVMIFGAGQADNFMYPALESVRILSLGFIDRFDIYGMILMSYGCYIRCSLYLRLACDAVFSWTNNKWFQRSTAALFSVGVIVFSLYLANDHVRIKQFTSYYTYWVLLLLLPLFLWLLSKVRANALKGKQMDLNI